MATSVSREPCAGSWASLSFQVSLGYSLLTHVPIFPPPELPPKVAGYRASVPAVGPHTPVSRVGLGSLLGAAYSQVPLGIPPTGCSQGQQKPSPFRPILVVTCYNSLALCFF